MVKIEELLLVHINFSLFTLQTRVKDLPPKPYLWVKKIKDATHNYLRMAKEPLCKVYLKEHVNFKHDQ